MQLELNEQEINHLIQVLVQRPMIESMQLYLKLTNQKLVPADPRSKLQAVPVVETPSAES